MYRAFYGGLNGGWMLLLLQLLALLMAFLIRKEGFHPGYRDAFIIGIAQACAVMPGLSRSGATIATGLSLGGEKDKVAPFSFLMVLVPVLGETFLEVIGGGFDPALTGIPFYALGIGFASAFLSGLLACRLMIAIVRKVKFAWFAVYCLLVGLACLIVPLL